MSPPYRHLPFARAPNPKVGAQDSWAIAEYVLPYNLPYKRCCLPSSGIFAHLQHPCSDRFTPSGAVQKNPSGRIISSIPERCSRPRVRPVVSISEFRWRPRTVSKLARRMAPTLDS
jgi:hypothetical protein